MFLCPSYYALEVYFAWKKCKKFFKKYGNLIKFRNEFVDFILFFEFLFSFLDSYFEPDYQDIIAYMDFLILICLKL